MLYGPSQSLLRGPKPLAYQVGRAGRPDRMLVDRGPGEVSRNRTMWPMVPLQLKRGSTPIVARESHLANDSNTKQWAWMRRCDA